MFSKADTRDISLQIQNSVEYFRSNFQFSDDDNDQDEQVNENTNNNDPDQASYSEIITKETNNNSTRNLIQESQF